MATRTGEGEGNRFRKKNWIFYVTRILPSHSDMTTLRMWIADPSVRAEGPSLNLHDMTRNRVSAASLNLHLSNSGHCDDLRR